MYVILSLLTLAAAVMVHETGHFLAARSLGIPVREFSVGFGPALFKTQKNGTVYALRPALLGGYVVPEKGAVEGSALLKQLLVYLAGPAANAACAAALAAVGFGVALAGKVPAYLLPIKAVQGGFMFVGMVAEGIAEALWSGGALDVAGPVGIIAWLSETMRNLSGPAVLIPAALLNLAAAFTNLVPFPALDGGRALMALFRVPPARQERAVGACLGLLLGLAALITYADIMRLLR